VDLRKLRGNRHTTLCDGIGTSLIHDFVAMTLGIFDLIKAAITLTVMQKIEKLKTVAYS